MSWWADRKQLKQARELVQGSRKMVRIQRDLMPARQIQDVSAAADALAIAVSQKDLAAIALCQETLERQLDGAFPRPPFAAVRENVEVLLVAVIVAMAVRSFFVQPFKIPTGSMQPTLYGIHEDPDGDEGAMLPKRLFDLVVFGRSCSRGRCEAHGDHIFVDRFTYHFRKPKRGEVVVFATDNIPDLPMLVRHSSKAFYIKRLIGLPKDTIQITPPYVKVNGQVLDASPAFRRIYSKEDGYNGYVLTPGAKYIRNSSDVFKVPDHNLFVLGDNSQSSLDGRFWGSYPESDLVGRAMLVYWPFTRRFGLIE